MASKNQKFNFHTKKEIPQKDDSITSELSNISTMVTQLENPNKKTALDNFKIIPRNKVRNNKKNKYPKGTLDSLKESILQYGIQQDITVVYITNEDMYVVETGHRRKAAVDELIEEYQNWQGDPTDESYQCYKKNVEMYEVGYVCKITGKITEDVAYDLENEENLTEASLDIIDSEIRLHITNIEARNDDALTRAANVTRLSKLYDEKNRRSPRSERINVNKKIAADLNMKERQVAYYKDLDKLIPELKALFEEKKITIKDGSNYSKLSAAEQEIILSLINSDSNYTSKEIETLLKQNETLLKQMKEKEEELLKAKKEKVSQHELEDKNMQIYKLEKELETLKRQNRSAINLDPALGDLIKTEIQVKSYITQCEKAISHLKELFIDYESMYNSTKDSENNNLLRPDDLREELKNLSYLLV